MLLYIVRHAHAVDAEEDPARPLSRRGREQVRALAAFLKRSDAVQPSEVWHSALARSVETADLLVRGLSSDAKRVQVDDIEGEDDPAIAAKRVQKLRESVAIVGHEPHLSALASLLVTGAAEPARFRLRKSAALALELRDGRWLVRWQVSPELLAETGA